MPSTYLRVSFFVYIVSRLSHWHPTSHICLFPHPNPNPNPNRRIPLAHPTSHICLIPYPNPNPNPNRRIPLAHPTSHICLFPHPFPYPYLYTHLHPQPYMERGAACLHTAVTNLRSADGALLG